MVTYKKLVKEFTENTTVHGPKNIATAVRTWAKVLWLLLFLFSGGIFAYQGVSLFIEYFDYPVTSSISISYNTAIDFPAITVCNQNRLVESKLINNEKTRLKDLADIGRLVEGCKAALFDEETGYKVVTTADLELGSYICTDGTTPIVTTIRTVEECIQYYWFDKIDEMELKAANKSKFIEEQKLKAATRERCQSKRRKRETPQKLTSFQKALIRRFSSGQTDRDRFDETFDSIFYAPIRRKRRATAWWLEHNNAVEGYNFTRHTLEWTRILKRTPLTQLAQLGQDVNIRRDEFDAFGHTIERLILVCEMDGVECSTKDFLKTENSKYGNCYTYNHGLMGDKLRKTGKVGAKTGLKLIMNIDQDEYVGMLTPVAGVRLAIHNPYRHPFPENAGINLSPGTKTTLSLRNSQIIRTQLPYGGRNCTDYDKPGQVNLYDGVYSFVKCQKSCIQQEMMDTCSCVDDVAVLYSKLCDVGDVVELECARQIRARFAEGNLQCTCEQRCHDDYWAVQYSTLNWPSITFEPYLYGVIADAAPDVAEKLSDASFTNDNILELNIFYEDLNQQIVAEEPKIQLWNMLSTIGGSMGLYVGVSVITVVELVELITGLVRLSCSK